MNSHLVIERRQVGAKSTINLGLMESVHLNEFKEDLVLVLVLVGVDKDQRKNIATKICLVSNDKCPTVWEPHE